MHIGIDFETYGSRDLSTVGLDNYVNDPNFRPLICSTAYRDSHGVPVLKTYQFIRDSAATDLQLFQEIFNWMDFYYAHNSGFEKAVLRKLAFLAEEYLESQIRDSAVIARINGADSHLENAGPQLLHMNKLDAGKRLIQKFSVPRKDGTALVDDPTWDPETDPDWALFIEYCERDALLSYDLGRVYGKGAQYNEQHFEIITARMNQRGWPVDLVSVQLMQKRMEDNKAAALHHFRMLHDPNEELNLGSLKQLKEWTRTRGIQASSFDEAHVESLIERISKKLNDPSVKLARGVRENYNDVLEMLLTKRTIGGYSLKKLPVILAMTGEDGRLRNQYMHCGAGQSYRTSGVGVQMQNLKRLSAIKDLDTLADPSVDWTNDELAENIRQCFTASNPNGALIVGDFSSVESRGLAYLAGAEWKLQEYRAGKDMYKVLASRKFGTPYEDVTKPERQFGKVGELSCGYGAGPVAVQSFAKGMGVNLTEDEALDMVRSWRDINPEVVEFWEVLDDALHKGTRAAIGTVQRVPLANNITMLVHTCHPPYSLQKQHPGAVTLRFELMLGLGQDPFMERIFQGCYERGRNVCYYKPAGRKTGQLWEGQYTNKKTKKREFFSLYGGKLAGILTQSFCRELFFNVLGKLEQRLPANAQLIGQFHDEAVVEWWPATALSNQLSLQTTEMLVATVMSDPGAFIGFPLIADVHSDYRYIK